MKAYMVFSGDPQDGCMLIYAETANKATSFGVGQLFDWDYIQMNCRRMPDYDQYADQITCQLIETNADLPEGAHPFYSDIEL